MVPAQADVEPEKVVRKVRADRVAEKVGERTKRQSPKASNRNDQAPMNDRRATDHSMIGALGPTMELAATDMLA